MINGVSVSHWQKNIDWQQVKKDPLQIKFAFIKATEGATGKDKQFKNNWQKVKNNGLSAGGYHFFKANTSLPHEQAANIHARLTDVNFNHTVDNLAIVVQEDGGLGQQEIADKIKQLIGNLSYPIVQEKVILYTSPDWWNGHVDFTIYPFEQHPLWVAHWTSAEQPRLPGEWQAYFAWQYTCKGNVTGINGLVCLSRMDTPLTPEVPTISFTATEPTLASTASNPSQEITTLIQSIPSMLERLADLLWRPFEFIGDMFNFLPGAEAALVQKTLRDDLAQGALLMREITAIHNNASALQAVPQKMAAFSLEPVNLIMPVTPAVMLANSTYRPPLLAAR